ncbi:MAG: aminoacyl-tRNA hydrolase [Spirochaetales bacterium]|nr:aminoacyl-tRNA hydrolase [Spirochaetales bacterium]
MDTEELHANIQISSRITFALSGGPGGQNVNKVNTKAVIHLLLDDLYSLSEEERARLKEKLKNKISTEGFLVVESSTTRSQFRNRQEGLRVIEALILGALKRDPHRRATRPSRASIRRRLDSKKRKGSIKKSRGRVNED